MGPENEQNVSFKAGIYFLRLKIDFELNLERRGKELSITRRIRRVRG